MLEALIRTCLRHRALVLVAAVAVLTLGIWKAITLPKDVLPELTRPTVTLLAPVPGLAPEEMESSVAAPIERSLQGVPGLDRLRTRIEPGLALVIAEFDYGADTQKIRRAVQERLAGVQNTLPAGASIEMVPETSLMGEILLVGFKAEPGVVSAAQLRDLAERTVRPALLGVKGVAEIAPIGGGVLRMEIVPDHERMRALGVSWQETLEAAKSTGLNLSAGFAVGAEKERAVRITGLTLDPEKVAETPVKSVGDRRIRLGDFSTVTLSPAPMRGDARVGGFPGVILGVTKQPGVDTPSLSDRVEIALKALEPSLPKGASPIVLFRQADFISHAADNLVEALRDGAIMVAVILILFLANIRTTLVTLTAIPLSLATAALTFAAFGMSVNAMTLGGLAVAVGLVVDDAVVDVENVFRRLRENADLEKPLPVRTVVAQASIEVRSGILYATLLIALAFAPLYALPGIEGKLFAPVATATIVAMLASFVISLTVVPALASLLLPAAAKRTHKESLVLRAMKAANAKLVLGPALRHPWLACLVALILTAGAFSLWPRLGKNFLPAFNEGSLLISMVTPPGTSITRADEIGYSGSRELLAVPEVKSVGQRVGRAENSDHVMGVNVVEYDIEFKPEGRDRKVVIEEIRDKLNAIPGTAINVGQPLAHRISHMISGVPAQIAVKLYGQDTDKALRHAETLVAEIKAIPGATDVSVERLPSVPQLRVIPDREKCAAAGVSPGVVGDLATGMIGGATVAELRDGPLVRPVVVRVPEDGRRSPEAIRLLPVTAPDGRLYTLGDLATVTEAYGPPQINRENGERRIVLSCNVSGADLESVANRVKEIAEKTPAPEGIRLSFEGEYEARKSSQRVMAVAALGALVLAAALLYSHFGSLSLAMQVLVNIPLAALGGIIAAWWMVGDISVATLIGFVAVAGIGARNTIMMIDHYLHLMNHEGEKFSKEMVMRGSQERLAPVLMTALAAGIALVPLLLAAGQPGKELLHPVAVVIVGGLISSTLLDIALTPTVFYHFGRAGALRALKRWED
jgi:CzcA family heavy metal efflux pump